MEPPTGCSAAGTNEMRLGDRSTEETLLGAGKWDQPVVGRDFWFLLIFLLYTSSLWARENE